MTGGSFSRTAGSATIARISTGTMRALIKELIETVILALMIFLVLQVSVQNFRVEGPSMQPTLEEGQYLLVNKLVYARIGSGTLRSLLPFIDDNDEYLFAFHPPRRGEVIIFRFPRDPSRDFVKRVIAVPGDALEVKDNVLYVNGVREDNAPIRTAQRKNVPDHVPPDSYFVLGDNRRSSLDSRDWGPVPSDHLIGRGWVSYWPLDRWNTLRAFRLP